MALMASRTSCRSRFESDYFTKGPHEGGGVMECEGISHYGKTPSVFVEANMKSEVYLDMLGNYLMSLMED